MAAAYEAQLVDEIRDFAEEGEIDREIEPKLSKLEHSPFRHHTEYVGSIEIYKMGDSSLHPVVTYLAQKERRRLRKKNKREVMHYLFCKIPTLRKYMFPFMMTAIIM